MGFSLPSTEVVGSTAALAPTRSALRAALCAGYTARPNGSVLPTRQRIQTLRSHHRRAFRRKDNPASPSLGFLGGLVRSEEVPEGRWGGWDVRFATKSLLGRCDSSLLYNFCHD